MNLLEYFENTAGTGVLSTADSKGMVDSAIYARPHVIEDGTIAFIMTDRLTYKNLKTNKNAVYLFMENRPDGKRFEGKRLYLAKIREEQDTELITKLRRRSYGNDKDGRFLVFFTINKIRPLIGD